MFPSSLILKILNFSEFQASEGWRVDSFIIYYHLIK